MHIVSIVKKIDLSLIVHRTKYSYEKMAGERRGTVIGPSYTDRIERVNQLSENLRLHTLPFQESIPLVREIRYCLRLAKLLRTMQYDILNLNSHLQISALPVLMTAIVRPVPLVVTVHGVYSKTNFLLDTIQKIYLHTFCRLLWKYSKAIVCLTEADANEITLYGCPKNKITIIPNWANTELFRPRGIRQEYKVLWAGRFIKLKGLEYLVKASKIIVEKYPLCRFVLLGDGPLKSHISRMISNENLSQYFELKGAVSNDVVAEEMASASVFAFPSLKEGMPFTVLEAAASGTAIVASNIPSTAAFLNNEEHALLVKPGDPLSLAHAIMTLFKNSDLKSRLQNNARKLVEDNYGIDAVIGKTLALYDSIVHQGTN